MIHILTFSLIVSAESRQPLFIYMWPKSVKKIKDGPIARTNKVVQRNKLFSNFSQGSKSFEKWSVEISNAAQLIDYTDYDWQQAAVDAMILQTSNANCASVHCKKTLHMTC